jgi:hypothetical protein
LNLAPIKVASATVIFDRLQDKFHGLTAGQMLIVGFNNSPGALSAIEFNASMISFALAGTPDDLSERK